LLLFFYFYAIIGMTLFASNDPWLVKLENISRNIWAAKDSKSDGQRLRWYFERVRGQYNVDLGKERTVAQKNSFKAANPPRTKFSKTDLALAALAWDLEPYMSSLGPQKCFANFAKRLHAAREAMGEGSVCEPSEEDFRRLCGIMILRREAMAICREIGIDPQISTSAVSAYAIARLSHDMKGKLPWGDIWTDQSLPNIVYQALRIATRGCETVILHEAPKNRKQPSEYAKKAECWSDVAASPMNLGLTGSRMQGLDKFSIMDTVRPAQFVEADGIFFSLDEDQWHEISSSLNSHHTNPTYSGCAKSMGENVARRRKPSDKQARILAKGLLLLRSKRKCTDILDEIPDSSWTLLQQISEASRS
jgi:hypothetical protein